MSQIINPALLRELRASQAKLAEALKIIERGERAGFDMTEERQRVEHAIATSSAILAEFANREVGS